MRTPVLEFIFNKVAGLQLYYKENPTEVFCFEVCEFLRALILKNTCQ